MQTRVFDAHIAFCPLSAMPEVESLNLAFVNISDAGLAALSRYSPRLCRLTLASKQFHNLWSCGLWTDAGFRAFVDARPDVAVDFVYS